MGEPIRVLHILQRMEAGGTQALLMNIYRKIDRTKVQFDFLVVYKEKQFYDKKKKKMGGHVYKLSFREDLNLPKFQKGQFSLLSITNIKLFIVMPTRLDISA